MCSECRAVNPTDPDVEPLIAAAAEQGVSLPATAAVALLAVLDRMDEAPHNLSAILGREQGIPGHLIDSLVVLGAVDIAPGQGVLDVGSGSGFPGMAVAAARPDLRVTLLESVGRKAEWLRAVSAELLPSISVVNQRSEDFAAAHREAADLALARALAPPPVALELCAPLVRVGGRVIIWAGAAHAEVDRAIELASDRLGLSACRVLPVHALPNSQRRLLVFDKLRATPARFPRRPGRAGSHPIA